MEQIISYMHTTMCVCTYVRIHNVDMYVCNVFICVHACVHGMHVNVNMCDWISYRTTYIQDYCTCVHTYVCILTYSYVCTYIAYMRNTFMLPNSLNQIACDTVNSVHPCLSHNKPGGKAFCPFVCSSDIFIIGFKQTLQ